MHLGKNRRYLRSVTIRDILHQTLGENLCLYLVKTEQKLNPEHQM